MVGHFQVMLPPEPKNLVRRNASWASGSLKCLPVVPRHPVGRIGRHFRGVALQFGEVVEGVGAAQFAGVDQAHEKIADLGAIERAVKQCILAVEHSTFQHLFAKIIINRRARLAQKYRQALPVPQHIVDRLAQG